MLPLISVVIPSYNHEKYIKDCINSLINQSYQNIELIIIDDGSQDQSVEIIHSLSQQCCDRFTRFEFRYRENRGVSATLQEALEWAQGNYFSPIASDDLMLPNRFSTQIPYLEKSENSNIGAIFSGINQIDENNHIVRTLSTKYKEYTFDDIAKLDYFLPAPTQIIRLTKSLRKHMYKATYKIEDWYSYLQITSCGKKILIIPDILCNYRRHENNSSKNMELMKEKIQIMLDFGLDKKETEKYLAFVYLSLASDFAPLSKKIALNYLLKSFVQKNNIVLHKRFWKIIIKTLTPKKILWKSI